MRLPAPWRPRGRVRTMASLASLPAREPSLRRVVASLLPQVDRLNVYLDGYGRAPDYLEHPRIGVARSEEHGDLGDAGKFFWLGTDTRYYLSCDDDILYPPDYVARTVAAIEQYGRRAVVGWHGSLLKNGFTDYYSDDSRELLSFYAHRAHDTPVHILGTGTLGFHVSTLRLALADFEAPNMADVWFSLKAQQQGVPLVVRAHRAGELLPIAQPAHDRAIWRDSAQGSGSRLDTRARQNEVVRANWPWTLHQPQPKRAWARTAAVVYAWRSRGGRGG